MEFVETIEITPKLLDLQLKTAILNAVKTLCKDKKEELKENYAHFFDNTLEFLLLYTQINGLDVTEEELVQAYLNMSKEMAEFNAKHLDLH